MPVVMSLVPKKVLSGSTRLGRHLVGRRARISHQAPVFLQLGHGDRVGDEHHVGLRTAGGELRLQLVHDLGRAGSEQLDLHGRVGLVEGFDDLRHLVARLRGVDGERARRALLRLRRSRQGTPPRQAPAQELVSSLHSLVIRAARGVRLARLYDRCVTWRRPVFTALQRLAPVRAPCTAAMVKARRADRTGPPFPFLGRCTPRAPGSRNRRPDRPGPGVRRT